MQITGQPITEDKIIYTTPVLKIGKHEWRVVVYWREMNYADNFLMERGTKFHVQNGQTPACHYEFRRCGEGIWTQQEHWPSYNSDDGCYGGMPISMIEGMSEKYGLFIDHAKENGLSLSAQQAEASNEQASFQF